MRYGLLLILVEQNVAKTDLLVVSGSGTLGDVPIWYIFYNKFYVMCQPLS